MNKSFFILLTIVAFVLLGPNLSSAQADTSMTTRDTSKVYSQEEILVTANRLKEERPVGEYKQPEWTLHRRFPSTRVYVQTRPGDVEFEQWLEIRVPPGGSKNSPETRLRQELAFGLGEHVQLDLYMNTVHERKEANSTFGFRGWSAEIRWAPADWGNIAGNPTLYFEYLLFNGAPDKIEPKLLFGDEISPRWHWGLNIIHERELAAETDRDEEYAATAALSYTLVDEKLSLGPSISFSSEVERTNYISEHTTEILIGPSIQWRPQKKAFLNAEPLFGITEESKKMKMFIVFGWEF